MEIFETTPHSTTSKSKTSRNLRYFHYSSCLILFFIFIYAIVLNPALWFIFLTNWGLLLSLIYFSTLSVQAWFPCLILTSKALSTATWGLNWIITLVFWCYIYPRSGFGIWTGMLLHYVPLQLTVIDYWFSEILIKRQYYFVPLGVLAAYTVVNVSFTLALGITIYRGITYKNLISYVVIGGGTVLMFIVLEIGRCAKRNLIARRILHAAEDRELVEPINY